MPESASKVHNATAGNGTEAARGLRRGKPLALPLGGNSLASTLTSPAEQLALQRLIGNQSAMRVRNRSLQRTERPALGLSSRTVIQRHGDAALQEQLEQAKLQEELQDAPAAVQRTTDRPQGSLVQRHLVPKSAQAADFVGIPTAAMAEKLRAAIEERAAQSRSAILQWLDGQNLDAALKDQKKKQIQKLQWKTSLQRLGGVAAKVDGATGAVQLFTRQADYYDTNGEVDTEFVQVTMIHEAFHALSANHTGFQDDKLFPEIRESLDEAFTDKYAAEAFHIAFGDAARYTSNYWLPGSDRWTGDLAEVVQQLSSLSREEIIASYLANPDVVTRGYVAKMLEIQDAWATIKGQDRPKSEADAKQQISAAVAQAKGKGLAPPPAQAAAAGPGAAVPAAAQPGAAAAAAAAAPGTAVDPALQAIYDFMGTLPMNRGMPKTMPVRPQLEAMVTSYNQNRHAKDHIQVGDLGTMFMKWKDSVTVTPVNDGHLKTAAEMLGLPTSDHSGINLIIPTLKSTLADTVSTVPPRQRTTAASAEFSQSTLGTVMGEGGDQSRKAAEILDTMGGGGYEATTASIFLHPKHNDNLPHYVHEVGHYVQHGEQGYFQGAKGGDQAALTLTTVLDYHNIIKNENPHHLAEEAKKGKQDDKRHIRFKYVGAERDIMGSIEDLEARGDSLPLSAEILEQLKEKAYCTDIDRSMLDEMFMLMIGNRDAYPAAVRSLIFTNLGTEWEAEFRKRSGP